MHENAHIQTVAIDFSRRRESSISGTSEMCWTIKGQNKAISEAEIIQLTLCYDKLLVRRL